MLILSAHSDAESAVQVVQLLLGCLLGSFLRRRFQPHFIVLPLLSLCWLAVLCPYGEAEMGGVESDMRRWMEDIDGTLGLRFVTECILV